MERYYIHPVKGDCLERLGILNRGGGYAIVDKTKKPKVGDVVHCLLGGGNVLSYIKQVKRIDESGVTVGTAYLDPSKDYEAIATEILGVVVETYGKQHRFREYAAQPYRLEEVTP